MVVVRGRDAAALTDGRMDDEATGGGEPAAGLSARAYERGRGEAGRTRETGFEGDCVCEGKGSVTKEGEPFGWAASASRGSVRGGIRSVGLAWGSSIATTRERSCEYRGFGRTE